MAEQKRILHQAGNALLSQVAFATSPIQVGFELAAALLIVFDSEEVFPFGAQGLRETIDQAKRHKLNKAGLVSVREVTPFMPAEKSLRGILAFEW